jgi:hypothetical protein
MRSRLPPSLLVLLPLVALHACSDVPRGDQGIDIIVDGSVISLDDQENDVSIDAHGPCVERPDPTGICAQPSTPLDNHLIVCTGIGSPPFLECAPVGASDDAGVTTLCCTTGLL